MPKRSLRSHALAQRRALSHESWLAHSHSAQQNILDLNEYHDAKSIALYSAAHNEIDTTLIAMAALGAGKRLLYPVVSGNKMFLRRIEQLDSLQKGAFGILEPDANGFDYQADEADLIIVPGIAFDHSGHRIGYGKGFYDRFLHQQPCLAAHLIGLCHDFQLLDVLIPVDTHDIAVEMVVTDSQVMRVIR